MWKNPVTVIKKITVALVTHTLKPFAHCKQLNRFFLSQNPQRKMRKCVSSSTHVADDCCWSKVQNNNNNHKKFCVTAKTKMSFSFSAKTWERRRM